MSRQSARSGLRPDQKPPELSRPCGIIVVVSGEVYLSLHANRRLLALNPAARTVMFAYKDYADDSRKKAMTLALSEFIRRFRLHILPERFVKMRHYGLLANRNRHTRIAQARAALKVSRPKSTPKISGEVPTTLPVCPHCRQPGLVPLRVTHPARNTLPRYTDSS